MKRYLLAFTTLVLFVTTEAQVYIGGGIQFWDNNDEHRTTISITPEVGYRVNKRFAFGAGIGYEYSKEKETHSDTYTVRPYLRHFVYSFNGFDLFWEGTFEFCYYNPQKGNDGYCIGIGARPGISYTINEHFCISTYAGFFGYRHCEKDFRHKSYEPGLGVSLTNNMAFIFHYYF